MQEQIREMTVKDYEQMIALWKRIDGLALSEADSREGIGRYLERNPGLSFICEQEGAIIGTILCGHDGRRGFIYHVAVDPACRKRQIGGRLVASSLAKLREEGIDKCHIFVIDDNEIGQAFWQRTGWVKRSGFGVFSRNT